METKPAPGARVQRVTTEFPVLHLEPEIPASDAWDVVVDGLVTDPTVWSIDRIKGMVSERRVWDLNCVWGWTRRDCVWDGIPAGRLIDAARPAPEARFVMFTARDPSGLDKGYSSCYSLHRARRCLLAWDLDGSPLTAEHGAPLRLVPPPTKWAYKAVKWVSRLTLIQDFTPGFWEGLVGDASGDVPREVLNHLDMSEGEEGR